MRTTIDLPDTLLRQLKSRAALEGTTLKALVLSLVESGLQAPRNLTPTAKPTRSLLPSISTGHALPLRRLSNAALFELLDEA
jgi:hypothetical protein